MTLLGLLTGMVQAYIFSILAGGLYRGGDARQQTKSGRNNPRP